MFIQTRKYWKIKLTHYEKPTALLKHFIHIYIQHHFVYGQKMLFNRTTIYIRNLYFKQRQLPRIRTFMRNMSCLYLVCCLKENIEIIQVLYFRLKLLQQIFYKNIYVYKLLLKYNVYM